MMRKHDDMIIALVVGCSILITVIAIYCPQFLRFLQEPIVLNQSQMEMGPVYGVPKGCKQAWEDECLEWEKK
jgi:hypothetical protein